MEKPVLVPPYLLVMAFAILMAPFVGVSIALYQLFYAPFNFVRGMHHRSRRDL